MKVPKYYTYEYCERLAKKYKSRTEFHNKKSFAYKYSSKMGWLDDFYGKKTELTYDYCKGIAKQFSTRIDLLNFNESVYYTCQRKKWLDDFYGKNLIDRNPGASIYTYDICKEIASKCKTGSEMKKLNARAYVVAYNNGWLYDFFKHQRILNYEFCKNVASQYATKKELSMKDKGVYCKCCKMGWINDFFKNSTISILELDIMKYCAVNNISFEYRKRNFKWLKHKHSMELDFYLPAYNTAIECQGIQHYEPRDFLGGQESFEEVIKRDEEKKSLCDCNNIKLFYYTTYKNHNTPNTYTNIDDLFRNIKMRLRISFHGVRI